jgi:hypothetical protein
VIQIAKTLQVLAIYSKNCEFQQRRSISFEDDFAGREGEKVGFYGGEGGIRGLAFPDFLYFQSNTRIH